MITKGFTLVELIIGAGIALVIIGAALTAITDFSQSQNTSQKVYDTLVASDSIFTQLTQDVHNADKYNIDMAASKFVLATIHPDNSESTVMYTWEPANPSDPTRLHLFRNNEIIHSSKVVILNDPLIDDDFLIEDYTLRYNWNHNESYPLILINLTLEHTSRQGSRTIYETSSKLSFRNNQRSI